MVSGSAPAHGCQEHPSAPYFTRGALRPQARRDARAGTMRGSDPRCRVRVVVAGSCALFVSFVSFVLFVAFFSFAARGVLLEVLTRLVVVLHGIAVLI